MVKDSASRIFKLMSVLLIGCFIIAAKASLIRLGVTIWAGAIVIRGIIALTKRDYGKLLQTLPVAAVALIVVWSAAATAPFVLIALTVICDLPEILNLKNFDRFALRDYLLSAAELILSVAAIVSIIVATAAGAEAVWSYVLCGLFYILKAVVELIRL